MKRRGSVATIPSKSIGVSRDGAKLKRNIVAVPSRSICAIRAAEQVQHDESLEEAVCNYIESSQATPGEVTTLDHLSRGQFPTSR